MIAIPVFDCTCKWFPMTQSAPGLTEKVVPARRAQGAARIFNYGNLITMLLPVPLGILWMGLSMVVYTMNRHHPNERVGYYTQQAAYRLYGVMGFVVVVATFFGTEIKYWLITWAISALILVPTSLYDLWRISKETWQDTTVGEEHQ